MTYARTYATFLLFYRFLQQFHTPVDKLRQCFAFQLTTCQQRDVNELFEHLTLYFYDTSLIEMSLMTAKEIEWLNAYHVRVYKETAPLLNADEAAYLARKCAAIEL